MSDTILQYHVVEENDLETFIVEVNDHIEAGWQPIGGIAVPVLQTSEKDMLAVAYAQALVRKAEGSPVAKDLNVSFPR